MNRRRIFALLLVASALGACRDEKDPSTNATPSPQAATAATGATDAVAASGATPAHLSLSEAIPSPIPTQSLPPDMPHVTAGRFMFYDDFEQNMDKWHVEGGAQGVGWHRLRNKSCGGFYVLELGNEDNKPFSNVTTSADLLVNKPIDLKGIKRPQLQYDLKGVTKPYEALSIRPQVRHPGGTWADVGYLATARYGTVVTFTASLADYSGGPIELRFHGNVKVGGDAQTGFFLDDIHVVEPNH